MTLTERVAEERPEVNTLSAVRYGIVTHAIRINGVGGRAWIHAGPGRADIGNVDPGNGAYRATAAGMTEAEQREAGLRRNGLPRRKTAN